MSGGMSLICPKCRGAFENITKCPRCGVALSDLGGRDEAMGSFAQSDGYRWGKPTPGNMPPAPGAPPQRWHQSPAGRLVAGILLALGLGYGLLLLTAIVLRLLGKAEAGALTPQVSLGIFYGIQVPGIFLAGMLAGVNRRGGAAPAALVALISGIGAACLLRAGLLNSLVAPLSSNLFSLGKPANPIVLAPNVVVHQLTYLAGLPLLYLICAVLGGMIGCRIWKPAPELALPTLVSPPGSPPPAVGLRTNVAMPKADKKAPGLMSGPIGWIQVLLGIGVAVAGGSFATRPVREFFIQFSDGALAISSQEQDAVTLSEVFALSILFGGMVGGATRHNGLLQGLIIGFGAGLGMVPFLAGSEQARYTPFIILSAIFLAPLGGWFGTTLLPPAPPGRLAPPP